MVSGIRFDEIETYIGTCFPVHFVVSASLYVSSITQVDSKSETAKFVKTFDPLCMEYWKNPTFRGGFLLTGIHSLG